MRHAPGPELRRRGPHAREMRSQRMDAARPVVTFELGTFPSFQLNLRYDNFGLGRHSTSESSSASATARGSPSAGSASPRQVTGARRSSTPDSTSRTPCSRAGRPSSSSRTPTPTVDGSPRGPRSRSFARRERSECDAGPSPSIVDVPGSRWDEGALSCGATYRYQRPAISARWASRKERDATLYRTPRWKPVQSPKAASSASRRAVIGVLWLPPAIPVHLSAPRGTGRTLRCPGRRSRRAR